MSFFSHLRSRKMREAAEEAYRRGVEDGMAFATITQIVAVRLYADGATVMETTGQMAFARSGGTLRVGPWHYGPEPLLFDAYSYSTGTNADDEAWSRPFKLMQPCPPLVYGDTLTLTMPNNDMPNIRIEPSTRHLNP